MNETKRIIAFKYRKIHMKMKENGLRKSNRN